MTDMDSELTDKQRWDVHRLVLAIATDVSSSKTEDEQTMKLMRWVAKLKLLGAQEANDMIASQRKTVNYLRGQVASLESECGRLKGEVERLKTGVGFTVYIE